MTTSLLYENYVSSSIINATSYDALNTRIAGPIPPSGSGSVVVDVQGTYTGVLDRDYRVKIDTVGPNGDFTGSTFTWSTDGGVNWQPSVTPVATTWHMLSDGVQVRFTAGPTLPYFVFQDTWTVRAIRKFGVNMLTDWSRNTEFRSAPVADGSIFDFVTTAPLPIAPAALVAFDHNWLSTTNRQLQSSTTSNFAAISFNQVPTWQAQKLVYLLTGAQPNHYWRLRLTCGTGQTDIRLGEWYLGNRATVKPYNIGFRKVERRLGGDSNGGRLAFGQGIATPTAEDYEVTFGMVKESTDLLTLQTAWRAMNDHANGDLRPMYLLTDDTDLTKIMLAHWANDLDTPHGFLDRFDVHVLLSGLARSL